jgi:hypothetical protein
MATIAKQGGIIMHQYRCVPVLQAMEKLQDFQAHCIYEDLDTMEDYTRFDGFVEACLLILRAGINDIFDGAELCQFCEESIGMRLHDRVICDACIKKTKAWKEGKG